MIIIFLSLFGFITGTVTSGGNPGAIIGAIGGGFIGLIIGSIFVMIGGLFLRFWWVWVVVGAVSGGGNTVAERRAMRGDPGVRVRCRSCGQLNPEEAKFCLTCGKPI